ncbi:acyl-CoA N-acyltransferase [Sporormia fimetaria CBS 119925]|uniref:Acyl-CoA N-acyltransferase n=1 Tax=Sporormia fimetaria CBS 119925 TaxID=1340428 RepID=A0A6A6VHU5_9PLEO|nr:acyl-CoA N-acyltransferase [Sporormia fimetaria CBS 119925]
MPRDLESEKATLQGMAPLTKEGEGDSSSPPEHDMPLYRLPSTFLDERFRKMKELHPYCLLLNKDDLDDCDWLEHAAFDPQEAASREKIEYRLRTCGELCSGIYSSVPSSAKGKIGQLLSSRDFPRIDTTGTERKRVLLGHIIATKHSSHLVTDEAMDFPKDWRDKYELNPSSGTGHHEDGQTVCLHSLCVHPDFHDRGLGRVLLTAWTQRIRDSGIAQRVALICRERYIGFYENAGFTKIGESKCQYGGGGWYDMVMEFSDPGFDDSEY